MSTTMINIAHETIQGMAFQVFIKSAFCNCMFYISAILLKHSNIVLFSNSFA